MDTQTQIINIARIIALILRILFLSDFVSFFCGVIGAYVSLLFVYIIKSIPDAIFLKRMTQSSLHHIFCNKIMSFKTVFCGLIWISLSLNDITIENQKPGVPSTEWDINGAGDPTIQGFAVPFYININDIIYFKINTSSIKYRIDIYRIGYYNGNGATLIDTISSTLIDKQPHYQPNCYWEQKYRMTDCANWEISTQWDTSKVDIISGVYIAKLIREDIDESHPKYNWRMDNPQLENEWQLGSKFDDGLQLKANKSTHNYGRLGVAKLRNPIREPYSSHIYFIVQDRDSKSDFVFQTSDTTWQTYNRYGNTSTYGTFIPDKPQKRALKASYNRPLETRSYRSINTLFSAEYPAIRFMERNGFDITYKSGLSINFMKSNLLLNHKVFMSVGHDEYYSMKQRQYIENARNNGVNLVFWSGNEMYWKIRYEEPIFDNNNDVVSANPIIVIFKETRNRDIKLDNESNIWTGTWRDEHFGFKYEGGPFPENNITGQMYMGDVWRSDPLHIPFNFKKHRFWRNINNINKLNKNEKFIIKKPIIGHEFDMDIDNGYRPIGLQYLSETIIDNCQYLQDWGITYDTGTGIHRLTLYRDQLSGAWVFGAGSIMFSWALDSYHDSATGIPPHLENVYVCRVVKDGYGESKEIQQGIINLFSDMDVSKPDTLINGLIFQSNLKEIENKIKNGKINKPNSGIIMDNNNKYNNNSMNGGCYRIIGYCNIDKLLSIGGIEIYIDSYRWYAGYIDYNNSDFNNNKYYWFFEFYINSNINSLNITSQCLDDIGYIETPNELISIKLNNLYNCDSNNWNWRPFLDDSCKL